MTTTDTKPPDGCRHAMIAVRHKWCAHHFFFVCNDRRLMGFLLPFLCGYDQESISMCVACAVAVYLTTWRALRQPHQDVTIFSADYIEQEACRLYRRSSDDGFTIAEIVDTMHLKGVASQIAFEMKEPDFLDYFVPSAQSLDKMRHVLEDAIHSGGFIFGIFLENGDSHCLYACGYDDANVVVQTSNASNEAEARYSIPWSMILSERTHSFTMFCD